MKYLAVAAVVAVLSIGTLRAEEPARKRPSSFVLLMYLWAGNPAVKNELKLSKAQEDKIESLRAEYRAARKSPKPYKEMTVEERENDRLAQIESDDKYLPLLDDELTETQRKRLREIHIRGSVETMGPCAAEDPPISDSLNVTEDQASKLAKIRSDWYTSLRKLSDLPDGEVKNRQARVDVQKRDEAANLVLTAEQKQRLVELCGEPFDIAGAIKLNLSTRKTP